MLPTNPAEPPTFTFFIYDHPEVNSGQALGNSRILYSNELRHCDPDSVKYLLEHVIDYYPFGKTLREYVFNRERFQTTYHERDEETGLDYRGARFYDGEVGRFLSCDPLASDFASWSTYSYTFNNPILFVDPDGRSAESTHLDEDGNVIASFDDGDGNVYEHANGISKDYISAFNYYASGNTGTNVTHGGGTQIAGSEISVTSTKSGFLVHGDGNFTLPAGETPYSMVETVWAGAGTGATASLSSLEIQTFGDTPEGMKGTLTTGIGFGIAGGIGADYEIIAVTRGKIILEQSLTGSNMEELFSSVNFVTTRSASAALKWTNLKAYDSRSLDNRLFNIDMFGAGVATLGVSGSHSATDFKKK